MIHKSTQDQQPMLIGFRKYCPMVSHDQRTETKKSKTVHCSTSIRGGGVGVGFNNALEDGAHGNGGAIVLLGAPLLLLSLLPAHLSQPPLHIEVPLENYL